jgi:hypothetical protein
MEKMVFSIILAILGLILLSKSTSIARFLDEREKNNP